MGMAGGAYQGDKDRAQFALQAAQLAAQRRAQDMAHQRAQDQLEEQRRQADMADARANRAMDIQEQGNQLRADQQNAALQERMRQNDLMDASRQRGLDIRDQIAAARQQAQDARLAKLAGQNDIFGQFQQVCDAEQKQTKARQARGQATMASMMKMGMLKGGTVPMAALNFANRQFGFDGKSQAIGAAGFMQNGNFFIDFLQKDPQSGQIARNTQVFNYEDMGRVLYSQAGVFDNKDRQQWREGMAKRGYSAQEINAMAGMNASAIEQLDDAGRQRLEAGFADPTATNDDWKAQYTRRKQEIDLQLAERKLAKQLGQNGLTPAQKYALYHFNEFTQPQAHEATQEDVNAGRAKKVGDQVYTQTTPDQAFKAAVEFFNKNAQNADPAVNPGQSDPNAQPPPSADPAGTGAAKPPAEEQEDPESPEEPEVEAPEDEGEAPKEPIVGSGAAAPGDNAVGQDELDFGGVAEPETPEAPAEGGEGGEAPVPAGEGGEGAPPPPPAQAQPPAEEPKSMAGAAGGVPGEGDEKPEEEKPSDNPFAKWVKRGKARK